MNANPNPANSPPLLQQVTESQRLERIEEYLARALANPDALAANLGAINSDLMRIGYRMMGVINQALAESPQTQKELGKLLPAIAISAQLARQIHRLAEFDGRRRTPQSDGGHSAFSPPEVGAPSPVEGLRSEENVG
jgi:hypothetical protein